ncbi:MAG: family 16 glycosylhydrolase [Flavobacteriaceae bacterium]
MVLLSCEDDDIIQKVIVPSNVSASINALTDGSGTVTVTPDGENVNNFVVTFAEGVAFAIRPGESATHTYATGGTYTITILAYGQGLGNTTITESVMVEVEADPNEPLFGSWVMANEPGSLGVGPAAGDTSWWAIDGTGLVQRTCYFNDTYVFGEDGSFTNNLGDETWLEEWQSGAPDACGAPVAPHDGSASATYSYDPTAGTLTLTGAGAYLGLPKAVNAGELPNVDVPDSTTYQVTLSENGNVMNVSIEAGPGVFWQYKMVKGDGSGVGTGGSQLETIYTNLVWSDEFDVDGAPDPTNWTYDLGAGGWGNGESQTYTDDPENVRVEGGMLKITAKGGGGPAGVIHYYDDITLVATGGGTSVIEDFEGTPPTFTGFGGANSTVVDNPDASGDNTSMKVGESLKNFGAETWAGSYFDVAAPLDMTTYGSISVKTWSPAVGAVVKLKLENKADSSESVEVDMNTTVAEQWETLTFDFSSLSLTGTYDRVVLFFDFGVSPTGGAAYTSARIKSENLFEFTYGRVEIRAKLPSAGGTWPALWALGANFDQVGWPDSGELDIMEHVGNNSNVISSALHYPGNSAGNAVTSSTAVSTATSEFHNYTMEWTPDSIKFVVDDEVVHLSFVNDGSTPFNSDFFLIMNVAMGGTLGGNIDPAFTEDTMEVDYIRVYQ